MTSKKRFHIKVDVPITLYMDCNFEIDALDEAEAKTMALNMVTENLNDHLENQFPWSISIDGIEYERGADTISFSSSQAHVMEVEDD